MTIDFNRFQRLGYDKFRQMAADESLSEFEKIGFPDSYRDGYGPAIVTDIRRKLTALETPGGVVIDIGCGCSDIPKLLIDLCAEKGHTLVLLDAPEMLDLLPDGPHIVKIPGYYPDETPTLFERYAGRAAAVLTYSVVQLVLAEGNLFKFFDRALTLLADGGQFLIGDIPNISKRKRFFASETGAAFHQSFMNTTERPQVNFNTIEADQFDDAAIMGLILRARAAGFDAYWLPQPPDLPMSNRREDVLIIKP
jgi:hypothetical protein